MTPSVRRERPGPRIGDDHRGGLSKSMPLVAAERVAGGDGVDETIGEMARLSFARLEALRDRLEHLRVRRECFPA